MFDPRSRICPHMARVSQTHRITCRSYFTSHPSTAFSVHMLVSEILGVRNGSNEKPKSDMETIGDGTGTGTPFLIKQVWSLKQNFKPLPARGEG